jgi:hypothetical protein
MSKGIHGRLLRFFAVESCDWEEIMDKKDGGKAPGGADLKRSGDGSRKPAATNPVHKVKGIEISEDDLERLSTGGGIGAGRSPNPWA